MTPGRVIALLLILGLVTACPSPTPTETTGEGSMGATDGASETTTVPTGDGSETTGDTTTACAPDDCRAPDPEFCAAAAAMCRSLGLDDVPGDLCIGLEVWCNSNGNTCLTCFLLEEQCRSELPSPNADCAWVGDACNSGI